MTPTWAVLGGDALARLRGLNDGSVQCVVTSPPYWGLRDYGVPGQLGLEPTPDAYVAALVGVFQEVRRVLTDDGVCWLNLGDSYATGAGAVGEHPGGGAQGARWRGHNRPFVNGRGEPQTVPTKNVVIGPMAQPNRMPIDGLKSKDLCGIPWRVAFALQADGWYLRSDIIWSKPNPMPESVTDRPTKAHEYVFLLSKSERYYYNGDAVREPYNEESVDRYKYSLNGTAPTARQPGGDVDRRTREASVRDPNPLGRNARSVWTITTQPYPEAHFATFPEALPERCIKAGSKIGDTVLDPFCGSGTTGQVAIQLGRSFIGIELNPTYAELARTRIGGAAPLFASEALCGDREAGSYDEGL